MSSSEDTKLRDEPSSSFVHRTLIIVGIVAFFAAAAAIFIFAANVFFLAFAGVLFALLLDSLSAIVVKYARISRPWALALVTAIILAIFSAGVWFLGATLSKQADTLVSQVPEALNKISESIAQYEWGRKIIGQRAAAEETVRDEAPRQVGNFINAAVQVVGGIVVIFFVGLLIAAKPRPYVAGILHLIPKRGRDRGEQVLNAAGTTLRRWLIGKSISMTAAGVMTWLGLTLIGIPLALTFGLLAAVLEFVPNFGPVAAAVPAILVAFLDSPIKALYVTLLYIFIQTVQSYLVSPFLEQKAVAMPMGLIIVIQLLFGFLFGALAFAMATPFAAFAAVLIKMLYVEDVVGDDVKVHGEE